MTISSEEDPEEDPESYIARCEDSFGDMKDGVEVGNLIVDFGGCYPPVRAVVGFEEKPDCYTRTCEQGGSQK